MKKKKEKVRLVIGCSIARFASTFQLDCVGPLVLEMKEIGKLLI